MNHVKKNFDDRGRFILKYGNGLHKLYLTDRKFWPALFQLNNVPRSNKNKATQQQNNVAPNEMKENGDEDDGIKKTSEPLPPMDAAAVNGLSQPSMPTFKEFHAMVLDENQQRKRQVDSELTKPSYVIKQGHINDPDFQPPTVATVLAPDPSDSTSAASTGGTIIPSASWSTNSTMPTPSPNPSNLSVPVDAASGSQSSLLEEAADPDKIEKKQSSVILPTTVVDPGNKEQTSSAADQRATNQLRVMHNIAAVECGAKLLKASPSAKHAKSILINNNDEYMNQPCASDKWFIIETCEPVQLSTVQIANYELFSSRCKTFRVSVSDRYPVKNWELVGTFQANDVKGLQSFNINGRPDDRLIKYVKFEIVDHYGNEHFCPITMVRLFGLVSDDLDDAVAEAEARLSLDLDAPIKFETDMEPVEIKAAVPSSSSSHSQVKVTHAENNNGTTPGTANTPSVADSSISASSQSTVNKMASTQLKAAISDTGKPQSDQNDVASVRKKISKQVSAKMPVQDNLSIAAGPTSSTPLLPSIGGPEQTNPPELFKFQQNVAVVKTDPPKSNQYALESRFIHDILHPDASRSNANLDDYYTVLYLFSTVCPNLGPRVFGPLGCPQSDPLSSAQLLAHCLFTVANHRSTIGCFEVMSVVNRLFPIYRNVTAMLSSLPRSQLITLTSDIQLPSVLALPPKTDEKKLKENELTIPPIVNDAQHQSPASETTTISSSNLESSSTSERKMVEQAMREQQPTGPNKEDEEVAEMVVPASLGGSWKETIYMRLNNKVRQIEADVSVSMRYLQELSQSYKKQTERLGQSFNLTTAWLQATAQGAEERDLQQQERIDALEKQLASLVRILTAEGLIDSTVKRNLTCNTSRLEIQSNPRYQSSRRALIPLSTSSSSQLTNQLSTFIWTAFFPPPPAARVIALPPLVKRFHSPSSTLIKIRTKVPLALQPIVCPANKSSSFYSSSDYQPQPTRSTELRQGIVKGLDPQLRLLFAGELIERRAVVLQALLHLFLKQIPDGLLVFYRSRAFEVLLLLMLHISLALVSHLVIYILFLRHCLPSKGKRRGPLKRPRGHSPDLFEPVLETVGELERLRSTWEVPNVCLSSFSEFPGNHLSLQESIPRDTLKRLSVSTPQCLFDGDECLTVEDDSPSHDDMLAFRRMGKGVAAISTDTHSELNCKLIPSGSEASSPSLCSIVSGKNASVEEMNKSPCFLSFKPFKKHSLGNLTVKHRRKK